MYLSIEGLEAVVTCSGSFVVASICHSISNHPLKISTGLCDTLSYQSSIPSIQRGTRDVKLS
jgi:hypothetical protein